MTEYHAIETYVKVDQGFDAAMKRFGHLLSTLGWMDSRIETWLGEITWEIKDDEFVTYGYHGPHIHVAVDEQPFDVWLTLLGWGPEAIPRLDSYCLELEILFETRAIDDLSRPQLIRYKKRAGMGIWQIMKRISHEGTDFGVFFTDESQSGTCWQGILQNDRSKRWRFELAIVFEDYKQEFLPVPPEYFRKETPTQLWLARVFSWDRGPWGTSGAAEGAQ